MPYSKIILTYLADRLHAPANFYLNPSLLFAPLPLSLLLATESDEPMPASFAFDRPISSEAPVRTPPRAVILFLALLTVAITVAILIFFFVAGVVAGGCIFNLNSNPNSVTFKDPESTSRWPESLIKLPSWVWARMTSSKCPMSGDGDRSQAITLIFLLVAVGAIALGIIGFGAVAGICLLHLHRLYSIMPNPNPNPNADVFDDDSDSFGLSPEDLGKLPSFEWSMAAGMTSSECAVCMDGFGDGDRCRSLPACGHLFHRDCVDEWLMRSNACPICRRVVLPACGAV